MAHPGGLRLQTSGVIACIAAFFRAPARALSLRGDRKQSVRKLGQIAAKDVKLLIAESSGEGVCKRRQFARIHASLTPMVILL